MKSVKFFLKVIAIALSLIVFTNINNSNYSLQAYESNPKINQLELGINRYEEGDYQKAIEIIESALPFLTTNSEQGVALNNLGSAYYAIGHLNKAIYNWEKAIEYLRKSPTKRAEKLLIESTLFQSQAYLDLGLTYKVIRKLKPLENVEDDRLQARIRFLLAQTFLLQEKFDLAIEYYETSLDLDDIAATKISLARAIFLKSQQNLLESENTNNKLEADRLKNEANKYLEKARSIVLGLTAQKEDLETQIYVKLEYFFIAQETKEIISNQEYRKTQILLEKLPDSENKIIGFIELAKYNYESKTKKHLLERAIEIGNNTQNYRSLALAYYQLALVYEKEKNYQKARELNLLGLMSAEPVAIEESTSDLLFKLHWQRGRIEEFSGSDIPKIMQAYSQAFWDLQYDRGGYSIGDNSLLFRLRNQVNPFLRKYITFLLESKEIETAKQVLLVLKLSELQTYFKDPCFEIKITSKLKKEQNNPQEATIYSFITSEKLYLLLELNNRYKLYSINIKREELFKKVAQYVKNEIIKTTDNNFVGTSQELYNIFVAPLAKDLPNSVSVLKIVPDEISRIMPWESLIDRDNIYLIEKYEIVNISGLKTTAKRNFLRSIAIFGLTESSLPDTIPLRNARLESESIALYIPSNLFLGKNFTTDNLQQEIAGKAPWIHLATHGFFGGTAATSYLETFSERINMNRFKDFLLESEKPIELLTLSGCQTAVGNPLAPLGFGGIANRAKIPYVLGSLWDLPDSESLPIFMEAFYQSLNSGETFSSSKRIAQMKLIEAGENPRFWAGIILIENID